MTRLLLALLLCAPLLASADAAPPRCASTAFLIDSEFESGNFARCKVRRDGSFDITIEPEDHKVIIEQPWYAFRVTAATPGELSVRLRFPDGYARYWPKLSTDGRHWARAPASAVEVPASQKSMTLRLSLSAGTHWIAAQELLSNAWYEEWLAELAGHAELSVAVIGHSVEGRALHLVKTANRPEAIVLLGRQHPAEIPGALAMRDFVATLLADTDLARRFRARFTLLILPLLNPDGVANGHWRHNSGRTDLNRDWGKFTQPETQAVARLLAGLDELGIRPRLMLDFHATKQTKTLLFYTQTAAEITSPPRLADHWIAAVQARLPDFVFRQSPGPSDENPNSKGYYYRRYGIPAYTYELADEVDRAQLHATTPILAEEMMRLMLAAAGP